MLNKVLCVDDDQVTLYLSRVLINRSGLSQNVETCMNGGEALAYFDNIEKEGSTPPSIVFLDLNMPGVDGWDFMKAYSQNYAKNFPRVKVVVLTSSLEPSDKEKSKEYSNIVAFLNKPLRLEDLESLKEYA